MENYFENFKKVHFIGIGGIGVSAIARMFKEQGKEVSGSDMAKSEITEDLVREGIPVYIGHDEHNVLGETDLVIHTIAIPDTNPELRIAKERGIKTMTYPEVLGELSKTMYTIAISGTHGKTTTTAMIAHILEEAGLEPTVIVGSKLLGRNSNFIVGNGKYLVVEACEYRRSFLNLYPKALIITNIETDHLDYYKDLADIQDAFRTIAGRVPSDGFVICDSHDERVEPVLEGVQAHIIDYKQNVKNLSLSVPGLHNQQNAQAALALGTVLGIEENLAQDALTDFKGTWRRLEYKGDILEGVPLYDDYAHHPTAIKAGIAALRESYPDKKLICVFEPHQQQRVKDFAHDFAFALSRADKVYIAPIYRAREVRDDTLSDDMLAHMIEGAQAVSTVEMLEAELRKSAERSSVIVLMGAGNIHDWAVTLEEDLG